MTKKVIGDPVMINEKKLSLSRAIQAGDYVFCTGQIPMNNGKAMNTGSIEEQTKVVIENIKKTLEVAGCTLDQVVKAMVWLRNREDFPRFDEVYSRYFPNNPPARSAVLNELLVDVKVEIEVIAYNPVK